MLKRVLIIDDAEDTEFLVRICMHANWPEAILEMYDPMCGMPEPGFDWGRYDLLLLDYDLGLPNQNGLTWLAQLIRQKHLPATIMLTSYGTSKLAQEAIKHGVDDFLDKIKLNPEQFFNTVTRATAEYRNKREAFVNELTAGEKTEMLNPAERNRILASATQKTAENQQSSVQNKTRISSEDETKTHNAPPVIAKQHDTQPQQVSSVTESSRRITTAANRKAEQPADIGIVVPGYRIQKKIGEGGMAAIYLAESDEDDLKVVLKVLSLKHKDGSNLLRRFMREYKLIAQLQHPNIVQIYERAFASDFAYIAMEYFGHGDLAQRLKQGLDTRMAMNYLHQITQGLGAAHVKGIVHRDMKPANILFRAEHDLAITDFGIAKAAQDEKLLIRQLTMEGELMGTLYYLSPEQIQGAEADQRSDIYSLGVIMYKMLTGKHPFAGATHMEVFEGHLHAPIPQLPGQFSQLQPLLDGLLAKDPDERFQSTDDLLEGLNWKDWMGGNN